MHCRMVVGEWRLGVSRVLKLEGGWGGSAGGGALVVWTDVESCVPWWWLF